MAIWRWYVKEDGETRFDVEDVLDGEDGARVCSAAAARDGYAMLACEPEKGLKPPSTDYNAERVAILLGKQPPRKPKPAIVAEVFATPPADVDYMAAVRLMCGGV